MRRSKCRLATQARWTRLLSAWGQTWIRTAGSMAMVLNVATIIIMAVL